MKDQEKSLCKNCQAGMSKSSKKESNKAHEVTFGQAKKDENEPTLEERTRKLLDEALRGANVGNLLKDEAKDELVCIYT